MTTRHAGCSFRSCALSSSAGRDAPYILGQYLAEKRDWEYESEGDMDYGPSWWEQLENEKTEHALKLLENYEQRYGKEKTDQ